MHPLSITGLHRLALYGLFCNFYTSTIFVFTLRVYLLAVLAPSHLKTAERVIVMCVCLCGFTLCVRAWHQSSHTIQRVRSKTFFTPAAQRIKKNPPTKTHKNRHHLCPLTLDTLSIHTLPLGASLFSLQGRAADREIKTIKDDQKYWNCRQDFYTESLQFLFFKVELQS